MVKFSLTQLKKQLDQKTKQELIKEISTLYKTFPQVKEYYQVQQGSKSDVSNTNTH